MPQEHPPVSTQAHRGSWIGLRARRCLKDAIEAVSASTDAPFRIRPIGARGSEQLFEAREEFELGSQGRYFVVGVDHRGTCIRVVSGGWAS